MGVLIFFLVFAALMLAGYLISIALLGIGVFVMYKIMD